MSDSMKILFYSSPDFSDNDYFLYKYFKEQNDERFHFIWLVSDIENFKNEENLTFLTEKSNLDILKDVDMTCCSHTSTRLAYKRFNENHIILNLGHGIGTKGLKKVKQMNEYPFFPSTLFNYILSLGGDAGNKSTQRFNNAPDASKLLPFGYPRNDILYNASKIKNKIHG